MFADQPKISFIVPCYEESQALAETVEAILAQPSQKFEIVLVAGGLADSVAALVAAYCHSPNCRVITAGNKGSAALRNLGLRSARGDYICVLDIGNTLEPTYLEKTIHVLDADSSIGFVSSWVQIMEGEDRVWKLEKTDLAAVLSERTVYGAALFRKSAFDAVSGYDEEIPDSSLQDWDLWTSLIEKGSRMEIIPEVLVHDSKHMGTVEESEAHHRVAGYLAEKHRASYEKHLFEVLLNRESESCELLKTGYAMERYLAISLEPRLKNKQEELERLKEKLRPVADLLPVNQTPENPQTATREHSQHVQELEAARRAAREEIRGLRSSNSWRITLPLRVLYDLMFGQR